VALLKGPVMYVAIDEVVRSKTKTIVSPSELLPLTGRTQAYRKATAART